MLPGSLIGLCEYDQVLEMMKMRVIIAGPKRSSIQKTQNIPRLSPLISGMDVKTGMAT